MGIVIWEEACSRHLSHSKEKIFSLDVAPRPTQFTLLQELLLKVTDSDSVFVTAYHLPICTKFKGPMAPQEGREGGRGQNRAEGRRKWKEGQNVLKMQRQACLEHRADVPFSGTEQAAVTGSGKTIGFLL